MAREIAKYECKECGQLKPDGKFWHKKDGSVFDICKECACKYIDNKKPNTFLWILKEADVPFIEERWIELCRKKYNKDPERFGPTSVIGTYLRTMYMKSFQDYTYKDTLELNKKLIEQRKLATAQYKEAEARAKAYDEEANKISFSGDLLDAVVPDTTQISMEDYEIDSVSRMESEPIVKPQLPEINCSDIPLISTHTNQNVKIKSSNEVPKNDTQPTTYNVIDVDEQAILDNLTPDDIQYLTMKWGSSFKPSEWVKMEELYQNYCSEFEIGVDRQSVLISLCKTSTNMQRCLDSGDAANASKFSTMFDQLRKSGAFTEAQKKEEKERYLDSVGEMVLAVEREGGVIPQFDYEFETNQDKVDLTIKDMKSYTYNLVRNEMGLGDLIESYVQKLEAQMEEEKHKSLEDGLITSAADEQQEIVNEEYADNWLNNLEDSIAADADSIYTRIGEEE